MKKFFSKKWEWIALIFMVLVIIFFASGFKIVYAPWMLNDWEAIGACASWVAAILSGIAIFVAVQIPKKIANEQNKISLFEKRFAFYNTLINCVDFPSVFSIISANPEQFCVFFVGALGRNYRDKLVQMERRNEKIDIEKEALLLAYEISPILSQGEFLFDFDVSKHIKTLMGCLTGIVVCYKDNEKFEKYFKEYVDEARIIKEDIIPKIKVTLNLS